MNQFILRHSITRCNLSKPFETQADAEKNVIALSSSVTYSIDVVMCNDGRAVRTVSFAAKGSLIREA